jgi:hypothetical protein
VTAAPAAAALKLLVSTAAAGVRLTLEGGTVRMVAAKAPTAALVTALRRHKAEITELLRTGGLGQAANDDGDPTMPCSTCGGAAFHRPPEGRWDCSSCSPPMLPADAAGMAGWAVCNLPVEDAPPGAGSPQNDDSAPARPGAPLTAEAPPGAPPPDWSDDRECLRLWRTAGPALTDRLPVAEAWVAAAPPQPLPRCLAAVELRRVGVTL